MDDTVTPFSLAADRRDQASWASSGSRFSKTMSLLESRVQPRNEPARPTPAPETPHGLGVGSKTEGTLGQFLGGPLPRKKLS